MSKYNPVSALDHWQVRLWIPVQLGRASADGRWTHGGAGGIAHLGRLVQGLLVRPLVVEVAASQKVCW